MAQCPASLQGKVQAAHEHVHGPTKSVCQCPCCCLQGATALHCTLPPACCLLLPASTQPPALCTALPFMLCMFATAICTLFMPCSLPAAPCTPLIFMPYPQPRAQADAPVSPPPLASCLP